MLRRVGFGFLWGAIGYLCGAFGGGFLISQLSSNNFDGDVEAAIKCFQQALQLDPNFAAARANLEAALKQKKKQD